ncbi:M1 family metallopeptidase [Engelhardtia mirabilis]|uniref:M1 family metallopeptidase n=1 Tax=Engelhardtia mirabilis TaxID=2528011 RepID=UPI003AF3432C
MQSVSLPRPLALRRLVLTAAAAVAVQGFAIAQGVGEAPPARSGKDVFRQLEEVLPTPNAYRNASGAPGHEYWQQKVDYAIEISLDEDSRRFTGSERITYTNNSPDELRYLWVQLENNLYSPDSHGALVEENSGLAKEGFGTMRAMLARDEFEGGIDVLAVRDGAGAALTHTVVDTMMRVDLPQPLASGARTEFEIDWTFVMNDSREVWARAAAEYFEDDGNWIFEVAHWFPRLAAYTDVNGWQHKQFLGRGEFTLEFGDYQVEITVPADHVVAATGVLQNPDEVLTAQQRQRLAEAERSDAPVLVITPAEADANEQERADGTATWKFAAENVRDFAWASSRKFAWDAMGVDIDGRRVLAMSYFPGEGEPLWSRYSTHAVAHTLEVYSKFAVPYPWPVAISVNGPVGGMEYPMICFNGPRPEEDGTYSARTKYGLISVVIHEVGHNWFPMYINSDERQWTWMDEGLNTFVQYLAEQEWEPDYPSRRGEPRNITGYMSSANQVPIMTNSETLLQFGNNAYAKPATALNVLRETVMGRELFDFAFGEYARRWASKRPQPADLFRTMEDASAVDLDWFWRGWFYTTDHVNLGIVGVEEFTLDPGDPQIAKARDRAEDEARPETLGEQRNAALAKRSDRYPELLDFYNSYDEFAVTYQDEQAYADLIEGLDPWERELIEREMPYFTAVTIANHGGLVMPVILELHLEGGLVQEVRIPAEIWRQNDLRVTKLLMTEARIESIVLDPHEETADVDTSDNHFPQQPVRTRFELFKDKDKQNPMQLERAAEKARAEAAEGAEAVDDGGEGAVGGR